MAGATKIRPSGRPVARVAAGRGGYGRVASERGGSTVGAAMARGDGGKRLTDPCCRTGSRVGVGICHAGATDTPAPARGLGSHGPVPVLPRAGGGCTGGRRPGPPLGAGGRARLRPHGRRGRDRRRLDRPVYPRSDGSRPPRAGSVAKQVLHRSTRLVLRIRPDARGLRVMEALGGRPARGARLVGRVLPAGELGAEPDRPAQQGWAGQKRFTSLTERGPGRLPVDDGKWWRGP